MNLSSLFTKYRTSSEALPRKTYRKPNDSTRRSKFIASIDEQASMIDAKISGKPFTPPTKKDGKAKKVKVWFNDEGTSIELRYAGLPIIVMNGKKEVRIWQSDDWQGMRSQLADLRAAAVAGQFDICLSKIASEKSAILAKARMAAAKK